MTTKQRKTKIASALIAATLLSASASSYNGDQPNVPDKPLGDPQVPQKNKVFKK